MTTGLPRALLVSLTLAGAGASVAAGVYPLAPVERPEPRLGTGGRLSTSAPALDSAAARAAASRPIFRADRRRSSVAYNAAATATLASPEPLPVPKPVLAVSGILWGPEPAALVEGLPGVEGSAVLRKGDSKGGVQVLGIEGERVVLRGFDTTWTLAVRNPWP